VKEYLCADQRFVFFVDQKWDSRIILSIRRHVKGGIITRFVGLRIKFVTGHTAQAQVKTGRPPVFPVKTRAII